MKLTKIAQVSNRTLLFRLMIVLAVLFGSSVAIIYNFSVIIVDRFNQREQEIIFAALESGPLQLARLNSGNLAGFYLNKMATEAHQHNPGIVGASIVSGPNNSDVYADWSSSKMPNDSCLYTQSKSVSFADAIYPFVLRLIIDRCATQRPLKVIKIICALVGCALIIITLFLCFFAALPIFSSLHRVTRLVELNDSQSAVDVMGISYIPLRMLSIKFLENKRLQQQAAVARMTQMLAHDVRRPFSILRIGIKQLKSANTPQEISDLLRRLVPEVEKSLVKVNGLIADVMEIGSNSTPMIPEKIAPEAVIENAISELCQEYPTAQINFSYDLGHASPVSIHPQKVERAFINILANAAQAMKNKGHVWFKSRSKGSFIEFCIGNSGSIIPPADLPNIFDAFFTIGKKHGTGLGLAIAKKVVTDHGGSIWCESGASPEHPDGKVEFFFTLPASNDALPTFTKGLPSHTSGVLTTV